MNRDTTIDKLNNFSFFISLGELYNGKLGVACLKLDIKIFSYQFSFRRLIVYIPSRVVGHFSIRVSSLSSHSIVSSFPRHFEELKVKFEWWSACKQWFGAIYGSSNEILMGPQIIIKHNNIETIRALNWNWHKRNFQVCWFNVWCCWWMVELLPLREGHRWCRRWENEEMMKWKYTENQTQSDTTRGMCNVMRNIERIVTN